MTVDGVGQTSASIALVDDGKRREIVITRPSRSLEPTSRRAFSSTEL